MLLSSRRGATLIEILATLVLITVGALGLAGTSALVARQMEDGWRQALAASIARARLEALAATPCGALGPGSTISRGMREHWSASAEQHDARVVRDSVAWDAARGAAWLVIEARVACRR
jgi:Tfp pilus assembly protein PilV